MDLLKELEKYKPVNYDGHSSDSTSVYIDKFNNLLHQIKGFAKQQLKTVQEVELIRDGISQKAEIERKLYEELLRSKTTLERQKKAILGGILSITDVVYSLITMLSQMENSQLNNAAQILKNELQKNLTNIGLIPINRVGGEFDPIYHYTVNMKRDDGYRANAILEIVRPGYIFEGEIIRKADVIVNSKGE